MLIEASAVTVAGSHAPLLPPTSVRAESGQVTVVAGEPDGGQTAFALALAGRLRPTAGDVRIDGRADARALRRAVALVDSPEVSAPDDAVSLTSVVAEELALAGKRSGRRQVTAVLDRYDVRPNTRFEEVPADVRLNLLAQLAASRPGVRALILDRPDRHRTDPAIWWPLANTLADSGLAVVVTCTTATEQLIDAPTTRIGEAEAEKSQPLKTHQLKTQSPQPSLHLEDRS